MAAGLAQARAEGVFSGGCVRGGPSFSCFGFWRDKIPNPHVINIPQPSTEQEIEESAERDYRWEEHCRPTIRQDRYGVSRYHYAKPGCEYGRFE